MARMFTDEDLDLMATPLSIRIERAAAAQDRGVIAEISEQMNQETLAIYDPYVQWTAVLQTFIVDNAGEEAHDAALRWAAQHAFVPFVLAYEGLDVRARAQKLASRLRAAGSTFSVEEDAERIRFLLDAWGGGSRYWRAPANWQTTAPRQREGNRYVYPSYGAYDPPVSAAVLKGARPFTQGRTELPCFFATEVLFLEILAMESLGYPIALVDLPDASDDAAFVDIHKDGNQVPTAAYERVGMSKPRSGLPVSGPALLFDPYELERLATPLAIQVEEAAGTEDWDRLVAIASGMDAELVGSKDPLGILIAGLLTWIARHLGEDAAEQSLERTAEVVMAPFVDVVRDLDIATALPLWAMVWRSHGSTFSIEETDETFLLRGRPLGACARMWSTAYQPQVERISDSRVRYPTFGCYDSPTRFHLMREPRGITHGKTNYPIYSTHCHMLHEVFAIDNLGYPLWVEQHALDDRDGETVHIHYKNPADWPAKFYNQVGRSKPPPV